MHLLQVLSDMENLRKRTSQQVSEAHQFALQGFCKNILDVADNLDRALGSVPDTVLQASQEGAASLQPAQDKEGSVTCETVAKNLCSLHNGVAMSNKVPPNHPAQPLHSLSCLHTISTHNTSIHS